MKFLCKKILRLFLKIKSKAGLFLNYECESFINIEPSLEHTVLFDHVIFNNLPFKFLMNLILNSRL